MTTGKQAVHILCIRRCFASTKSHDNNLADGTRTLRALGQGDKKQLNWEWVEGG